MNRYQKLLFYYCLLISVFMSISGILSSDNVNTLAFQLLFLPITLYFCFGLMANVLKKRQKNKKIIPINKHAIIITLVFFILLLLVSIIKVFNNSQIKPSIKPQPKPTKMVVKPEPTPPFYVVVNDEQQTDPANIYSQASLSATILGEIDNNQKYQLVSKKDQWLKIKLNTPNNEPLFGFVNNQLVKIVP